MAQQAHLATCHIYNKMLFYHITCQNNLMPNFPTTDTDIFL